MPKILVTIDNTRECSPSPSFTFTFLHLLTYPGRTFEKKLAGNIKNDSKSLYAYVRSKQKVRDKVGPLENNRGNIISDGFQMVEVLNVYFSSVFITEDINYFQFYLLNLRAINQNI